MARGFLGESRRDARAREKHKASKAPRSDRSRRSYGLQADRIVSRLRDAILSACGPSCRDFEQNMRARRWAHLEAIGVSVDQALRRALEAWRRAIDELDRFREEEKVERDVEQPDNRTAHLGGISLVVLIEFLAAAAFFGQYMSSVVFGLLPAAGPAVVTGGLGFFTALALGQLHRHRRRHRVAGAAAAIALVLLAVGLHLASAHYRDSFEHQATGIEIASTEIVVPDLGEETFLEGLFDRPVGLSGTSFWMFAFGIVAFALVVYEWRQSDDPLPGYGKRVRAVDSAAEWVTTELERVQDAVLREIHGAVDHAEAMLLHTRATALEALDLAESSLRKLGIGDPTQINPQSETDPYVLELAKKCEELSSWLHELDAIGDIRTKLGRRPDDPAEGEPVPREIEELAEAVSVVEAMNWLDRTAAEMGFRVEREETPLA